MWGFVMWTCLSVITFMNWASRHSQCITLIAMGLARYIVYMNLHVIVDWWLVLPFWGFLLHHLLKVLKFNIKLLFTCTMYVCFVFLKRSWRWSLNISRDDRCTWAMTLTHAIQVCDICTIIAHFNMLAQCDKKTHDLQINSQQDCKSNHYSKKENPLNKFVLLNESFVAVCVSLSLSLLHVVVACRCCVSLLDVDV